MVPVFVLRLRVTYYITPNGGNPLPVWRTREVLLNRETSDLVFTHEELAVLAMECAELEPEFVGGEPREVPLERINIVGIIPLAD